MFVWDDKNIEPNPRKNFKFYPRTGKVVFEGKEKEEKEETEEKEKEEKKVVKKDLPKK